MEKYPKADFENVKISQKFCGTFRVFKPFYNEIDMHIFLNWPLDSHTKTQRIYA